MSTESNDFTIPTNNTNRRRFLGGCLATGVAVAVPLPSPGQVPTATPSEKLNMAIIGCGGRGLSNMAGVQSENIYALCDTNAGAFESAKAAFPDAIVARDWRELIDDDKIDAYVISTADHHHAPAAIAAMRAGKHVYCEKPLAHTVREARLMREVYRNAGGAIATQMGTQIHAEDNYRRVVEIVRSGMLGTISEAHVWCNRGINPVDTAVLPEQPIPDGFAWDAWLGPAADRAYNEAYWKGGNLNWNRRWEFGNGVLGDMGSHLIDLAFWALDLSHPTTVESQGPEPDDIACPTWQEVTWTHPGREGDGLHHAPCKVVWYHGSEGMQRRAALLQPKLGEDTDINQWGIGVAFIGDEGLVVADYGQIVLSPSARFADKPRPEQSIPKSLGHYQEWLHAAKSGGEALCNFDYSGALIEHNLLGNVAHRVGKKLEWDAESMTVTNSAEANDYLTKTYREEWKPEGI